MNTKNYSKRTHSPYIEQRPDRVNRPVAILKRVMTFLLTGGILGAVSALQLASADAAVSVTNVSITNISNPDELRATGNHVVREYRCQNISTTPVAVSGNRSSFTNHFAWFQGMRVNQPDAPNFALIYRKNIGYDMTFTVEDPLNEGYTIDVDHLMRGRITVSREEPIRVDATSGLLLGYLDAHDGNGPIHYPGFFMSSGTVAVPGDDPQSFQSQLFANQKQFAAPFIYTGTNTFTITFSSFPSPALINNFRNLGGGEGIIQFGLPPTHAGSDVSRPGFEFAGYSEGEQLSDLGQFVTVTVTGLGEPVVDTDGDGIPDDEDNCPETPNADQLDTDQDGVGDICDNCVDIANPDQTDTNGNGIGDCCDIIEAGIDVKPGSTVNPVNPKSKGRLPVAIVTSEDFDATTVIGSTVRLGTIDFDLFDHGVPPVKVSQADIDNDADTDLMLHFSMRALAPLLDPETGSLVLVGTVDDGSTIFGEDSIRIVPPRR